MDFDGSSCIGRDIVDKSRRSQEEIKPPANTVYVVNILFTAHCWRPLANIIKLTANSIQNNHVADNDLLSRGRSLPGLVA